MNVAMSHDIRLPEAASITLLPSNKVLFPVYPPVRHQTRSTMDIDDERPSERDPDDTFEPLLLNSSRRLRLSLSSTTNTSLADLPPFSTKIQSWKRHQLGDVWARQLDRVNVLGSGDHGHRGSVVLLLTVITVGFHWSFVKSDASMP